MIRFFLGNLPYTITEEEILTAVAPIKPLFIKLLKTAESKPNGCAYVGVREEDEPPFREVANTLVFNNRKVRVPEFVEKSKSH